MDMKPIDKVSMALLMVGGLNWGIVGLFNNDLVGEIFGYGSTLADIIYIVIGAAAVYSVFSMVQMMQKQKKA